MACRNGFEKDAQGCPICKCITGKSRPLHSYVNILQIIGFKNMLMKCINMLMKCINSIMQSLQGSTM